MMKNKIGRRGFLKTLAASMFLAPTFNRSAEASAADSKTGPAENVKGNMPVRKLGSTGTSISILQQGTSQILNPFYDKVLHLCYREGVNGLDTALSYGWGQSHRSIATFLDQIKDRKGVWITSKSHDSEPDDFLKDLDKCLDSLKTDYIDLYLMHSVSDTSMLSKEFLRAGDKARKSGKTRFFGLSTHSNCAQVMTKAAKTGGIDAILFRYNFRYYGDKTLNLAIDASKKAGIGLIAMKTMSSISEDDEKVIEFKSKNFSLAQAKLKSVWEDERIDSIVCEMANVGEAKENIAAAKSVNRLSANELHQLNRLSALTASLACAGCSNICESGIEGDTRISDILRYKMYYEGYGKKEQARALYNQLPLKSRTYNRADVLNVQKRCPQGIDIAGQLKKAETLLKT